jgi:DNA-binding CsgD family transcriptional regulator/tetratricopeptide (TPR) repeat protein
MAKNGNGNKAKREQLDELLAESFRLHRTEPRRAIELALRARDLSEELRDVTALAKAHYRVGCAKRELCEYPEALEHLDLSIAACNKLGDERQLSAALHIKGSVLLHLGRLSEAKELLNRSAAIRRELSLNIQTADSLTDLATANFRLGDYAAALEALYEGLQLLEGTDEEIRLSIILSVIGSIYLEANYDQKAEEYLTRSLAITQRRGDQVQEAILRLKLFSLDRSEMEASKSISELEAIRQLVLSSESRKDLLLDVDLLLAEHLLKSGDHKRARDVASSALEIANDLNVSIKRIELTVLLGEISLAHETEHSHAAEDYLANALRLALDDGAIVQASRSAGKLALLYSQQGRSERAVEYLLKERELLSQFNVERQHRAVPMLQARIELERAERERERLAKENEVLEQVRDRNNAQLASLALHLVHKNEFLAEIRETLTSTDQGDEIVRRINEHVRGDNDWQQFEDQLNAMQGDFLTQLSKRYPDLTTTERKVAGLMRLNLSSKAVANLLCLSVRTVENHRLNIRKKLELPNDVNLLTFLGSL